MTLSEKSVLIKKLTSVLPVIRKSIGLTQEQLSAKSGVARGTISSIERGHQEMSWGTFMSVLSVFKANDKSRHLLETYGINVSETDDPFGIGSRNEEEMIGKVLGGVPLAWDLLSKVDIGLWAIEIDAGQKPRMYVDDTMVRLVGIDRNIIDSPEKVYSAWYDHVDSNHYEEVLHAIRKMTAGEHAEVQYPWHHPNGTDFVIRCGGKRNFSYKRGIRIEGTHQNVTELSHFQKSKLGTIELDKDILAKSNIGLWAFELDEGSEPRMYVDDTMLGLIGLDHQISPEETYHAWYDNIDPDHYDEVQSSVEKMTSGVHAEVQYPWHHPDGSIWTVRCGGVRNYAYTKGIRIEGTHQNVTELVHFQKKGLADMLAALSDEFLSIYFLNPYTGAFEAISTGSSYDADDGRDFSKVDFYEDVADKSGGIVHPDDKPIIDKMYARENLIEILESDTPADFIVRWPTGKEDECVYMENEIVPFIDDNGEKKLIIGVMDVTENKLKEKQIEDQLKTVEGLSQDYDSVMIVVLSEDKKDDRIIQFRGDDPLNKAADIETIEGISFSQRLDMYMDRFVYCQDRDYFYASTRREIIFENLQKSKAYFVNFRIESDGEIHYQRMKFAAIRNSEGEAEKLIVAFSNYDDTMRQQLEQQEIMREALKQAESANEAKSSFLFNMSHDIRTPMNAIIGFNNMAISHIDDREKVEECLKKVNSSSRYLLSIINDVLEMARISSGEEKCELEPSCITEEAEHLISMINEAMPKDLTISTDFSQVKHDNVLAARVYMNRIMTNILNNSVEYTPEGGKISYTIRETPKCCEGHYSYDFIVEDTGIGMSEEYLEHIFEEFSREENSTLSGVQGTGLGMSITKKLIDILGGKIDIRSRRGEGTTVTVHMDMEATDARIEEGAQEATEADLSVLKGKNILLVEDNDLNCEIATDILEGYGLVIDTAENGEIAVEKYRESIDSKQGSNYDLILMDVQMPVMDGYEATRVIRSFMQDGETQIPIVAMTANAFEEDKKKAIESGMNEHLGKPIDRKKLEKVLIKYIK